MNLILYFYLAFNVESVVAAMVISLFVSVIVSKNIEPTV